MKSQCSRKKTMIAHCLTLFLVLQICSTALPKKEQISAMYSRLEAVSVAFVLPSRNLTTTRVRDSLKPYFKAMEDQDSPIYRFYVNPVYTANLSVQETIQQVFCSRAAIGTNAAFVLIDKSIQQESGTQLANFIAMIANNAGMPIFLWSTHAFELESDVMADIRTMPRFLLSPSVRTQARALYAFLQTHTWQKFSLIESLQTPGHQIFSDELHHLAEREHRESASSTGTGKTAIVHEMHYSGSRLMRVVKLTADWKESIRAKLMTIRDQAKTRFIFLYVNQEEAEYIFSEARILGMTSSEYTWVAAKGMLGDVESDEQQLNLVPGTVVATYDTSEKAQLKALEAAVSIWSQAVKKLVGTGVSSASPNNICSNPITQSKWPESNKFIDIIMESDEISNDGNERVSFDEFGVMELSKITLINLDVNRRWSVFGDYSRNRGLKLQAREAFHSMEDEMNSEMTVLKIVTLQEPPYVSYEPLNPLTNSCPRTAIPCQLSPLMHEDHDESILQHSANDSWVCCVGFCIDLLRRLSSDIGFKFTLYEVSDRKWGSTHSDDDEERGTDVAQWNGLIKALMLGEADLAMTSLKINSDRAKAIDFSVPFLDTGITMVVSTREVATSATAFLEPFSTETWVAILVGLINLCALAMFLFEYSSVLYLSNSFGDNPSRGFTPFASLWLAWTMLFKAVVRVEIPKTLGAKVIACIWGMFCVIFASSYMANLAVFMITKEEFHDFIGLEDQRITQPFSKNPPWKYATITHGATEQFVKANYPDLFDYMKKFNKSTVDEGIEAVRNGSLDAFVYDASVLVYKSSRDKDCKLKTVGKWYATTGYGIGFPQRSKWVQIFDQYLINYQHNGFIQQLIDFWLTGECQRYKKQDHQRSYQLGFMNFASAFLLLLVGISLCFLLLLSEHVYWKYVKKSCLPNSRTGYLWDKLLRKLRIKYVSPTWRSASSDSIRLSMYKQCKNCGGQGHTTINCSSPPMRHIYHSYQLDGPIDVHVNDLMEL